MKKLKNKVITVTKRDVQGILDEVRTMKIKYCIHCKVAQDSAELRGIECKTRNMLGTKIKRHVFRVKN